MDKTICKSDDLKPIEDKFENFYIRYKVNGDEDKKISLDADVWEVQNWDEFGKPVFHSYGAFQGGGVEKDPSKAKPLFSLYTKWDSCSHLHMKYLHFDGLEEFDSFSRCVKYIYDDLCEKEGVEDL